MNGTSGYFETFNSWLSWILESIIKASEALIIRESLIKRMIILTISSTSGHRQKSNDDSKHFLI